MTSTIGGHVRSYRLRRGLTQARLAHLVGRSERWLLHVERGDVDPRLSDAVALARVLRVRLDDLAPEPAAAGLPRRRPLPGCDPDRRSGQPNAGAAPVRPVNVE
jgi:DNA-binding XRE family transcriptional regulator